VNDAGPGIVRPYRQGPKDEHPSTEAVAAKRISTAE
jgi:hypothetical protein